MDALPPIDPALFRRVMGRFATGVAVVTVATPEGPRGMTANAFMSASLAPPLCVVAVSQAARMHRALEAAGQFGVSFLAEGQHDLSNHFAGRPVPGLALRFAWHGATPVLADAIASLAASLQAAHGCGDHTLFVGLIRHLEASERSPLLYFAGRYGALDRSQPAPPLPDFW
jgi:flavin reductase (DIM6/NTAB) family NADH-FMN oxidoreductase RutF